MSIVRSIEIHAPAEVVFCLYADVLSWPNWDPEVAAVHLPEGLTCNAVGWLKPRKGPRAAIVVAAVNKGRSFTIRSRLPLCDMLFEHDLVVQGGSTRATHKVTFSGPLSLLFRRLIGGPIEATLADTLAGLKSASEKHER